MKLLLINRKLVLRGRKLALAVAGCFSRCCGGGALWVRADLCTPDTAPPLIPRKITFPDGFVCLDNCPISGNRIIIYRGYCYKVVSGPGTVDCGGPRPAPLKFPQPPADARVVAWTELTCKPIVATCLDNSCAPVEPGCCSLPYQFQACDTDPPVVCNLPKSFRVTRRAEWRWRSTLYADPGSCAGLAVCEEVFLSIDGYADYACQENGAQTTPVCVAVGGTVTVSGWVDSGGTGGDINGTYPFGVAVGSPFTGFAAGFVSDVSGFGIPFEISARLHPPFQNYPFCSGSHGFVDDPVGCFTRTVTCPGGNRSVLVETARCANGEFDNTVYRDCFLWSQTYTSVGRSLPPCPPDERWNDSGDDFITLTILTGCEDEPPWAPDPTGPERPIPYAPVFQSTAAMLTAMGG